MGIKKDHATPFYIFLTTCDPKEGRKTHACTQHACSFSSFCNISNNNNNNNNCTVFSLELLISALEEDSLEGLAAKGYSSGGGTMVVVVSRVVAVVAATARRCACPTLYPP